MFYWVLRFPLPILIPPIASHSSSNIRGWYNRPVSSRRTKWTQSRTTPRNLKKPRCCNVVVALIVFLTIHGKVKAVCVRNWLTTTPWRITLTSTVVWGEWSVSRPGRSTFRERAPCTYWMGGWVGPRTSLDDVERRKILPLPVLKLRSHGRPTRNQSLYRLLYSCLFNVNVCNSSVFRTMLFDVPLLILQQSNKIVAW
jgi:hypothetical protein